MTNKLHRFAAGQALAWIALAIGVSGCGQQQSSQPQNLRLLAVLYAQYRASHRGELPKDEQELKDFIAKERPQALANAGIANVDELFVSQRDGQPFVLRYRAAKDWPLEGYVAYEQQGADGVRHAATDLGGFAELSEEQFQAKASPAPK